MPRKVGFHIYTVRVKQRYHSESETLSSICGEFDLMELLRSGLKKELENHKNDESAERMACMKKVNSQERSITGLLNAGHYGEASDIISSINAALSYEKKTTDAEMIPCFFRIDIPEDKDEALLILQRDNRVSCKGAFTSLIAPLVAAKNPNLAVAITPLTSAQVFKQLVSEGEVQRLRFIRMGITDDFADSYDKGHKEVEGSMELVVKARRGFSLPFKSILGKWLSSKEMVNEIFEVPALDFDTVKADVKIGRTVRTLDFGKKFSQPIVDLTADVKFGSDGHPTYASLVAATQQLAADQLSEMYD
jgi:hypothetical protein